MGSQKGLSAYINAQCSVQRMSTVNVCGPKETNIQILGFLEKDGVIVESSILTENLLLKKFIIRFILILDLLKRFLFS